MMMTVRLSSYAITNVYAKTMQNKHKRRKMMQEKLEQAIEKYVDALDLQGLIDYVTNDMIQAYHNADSETQEEFILWMDIDDES
jgi:hypothetical protein